MLAESSEKQNICSSSYHLTVGGKINGKSIYCPLHPGPSLKSIYAEKRSVTLRLQRFDGSFRALSKFNFFVCLDIKVRTSLRKGVRMNASLRHGKSATALHKGRSTVGRQIGSTIRLFSDPEVSRKHCTLKWNGSELEVENHSDNGTQVNGRAITGSKRLVNGDLLKVGCTELHVEILEDEQTIESPTAVT